MKRDERHPIKWRQARNNMPDVFPPEKRSEIMGRIKGKDTSPELAVRSTLHAMGYRFRLHRKDLPGKPDIVLPKYKTVVFVNGCFWHGHDCRKGKSVPATNTEFWKAKIDGNVCRDRETDDKLKKMGWRVLVVWECEVSDRETLCERLASELGGK
jgi:DNA mismatch endonuclease (patch repair protein)